MGGGCRLRREMGRLRLSGRLHGHACRLGVPVLSAEVPRNVAPVAEAHWAHGASVGLLPSMGPLVPRKVALLAEAPWAH